MKHLFRKLISFFTNRAAYLTEAAHIVCTDCRRGIPKSYIEHDNPLAYEGYTHNGQWCPASDLWKEIEGRPRGYVRLSYAAPLMSLLAIFAFALPALGQSATPQSLPSNLYAAGVSANPGGSPQIAGTGLYAKKVADNDGNPTYAFTVVDALPTSHKPFSVNTNFGAGIAQKVFTIGKVNFFVPTSAGISYHGQNTGWEWTTGGAAVIPVSKKGFYLMPNLRVLKSSVSNDSGYQVIAGILVAWGK